MNITVAEIKEVLETLPLGFYSKRRVNLDLDLKAETSYYEPFEDTIMISPSIIISALASAEDTPSFTKEVAIRSMLYHELSHAILTPSNLMEYGYNEERADVLNIFEDERIETILKDFYYDVNFKKQVLFINGGKIAKPTDNLSAFYNLVRFRQYADTEFATKVNKIIYDFRNLSRTHCEDNDHDAWYYQRAIFKLYDDFCKWLKKSDKEKTSTSDTTEKEIKSSSESKATDKSIPISAEDMESIAKPSSDAPTEETTMSSDVMDIDELLKTIEETTEKMPSIEVGKSLLDDMRDSYIDTKVYNALNTIIANFNKKNSKGCGFNAYSGIFNPRAVAREDYKYFERSSSRNGNNMFGTLHLNFFLDDSGSYRANVEETNKILLALDRIEKQNKNFSFDVYLIANHIKHLPTEKRKMSAGGGNWLRREIFSTFKNAQKPNTYNYNIVMFDGDAFSRDVDNRKSCVESDKQNFRAFDTNNTTIISDSYNKRYINGVVSNAKVIYSDKFVQEISDNTIKTLNNAFR